MLQKMSLLLSENHNNNRRKGSCCILRKNQQNQQKQQQSCLMMMMMMPWQIIMILSILLLLITQQLHQTTSTTTRRSTTTTSSTILVHAFTTTPIHVVRHVDVIKKTKHTAGTKKAITVIQASCSRQQHQPPLFAVSSLLSSMKKKQQQRHTKTTRLFNYSKKNKSHPEFTLYEEDESAVVEVEEVEVVVDSIQKKVDDNTNMIPELENNNTMEVVVQESTSLQQEEEQQTFITTTATTFSSTSSTNPEEEEGIVTAPLNLSFVQYVAFEPLGSAGTGGSSGTTSVTIQVHDIQNTRKAWKKRRRSDSPLLIPCSIISIDDSLSNVIMWNMIYLLEKFGTPISPISPITITTPITSTTETNSKYAPVRISLIELMNRYKSHLKVSLQHHATLLGYQSVIELCDTLLYNKNKNSKSKTIKLDNNNEVMDDTTATTTSMIDYSTIWLESPLSRYKARKRSNDVCLLQFAEEQQQPVLQSQLEEEDDDDVVVVQAVENQNKVKLLHTGMVRNRRTKKKIVVEQQQVDDASSSSSSSSSTNQYYKIQPLSVALRLSHQEVIDLGNVLEEGSIHSAVVFQYDPNGDGGVPLLTMSLSKHNYMKNRHQQKRIHNRRVQMVVQEQSATTSSSLLPIDTSSSSSMEQSTIVSSSSTPTISVVNDDSNLLLLRTGTEVHGRVMKIVKGGVIIDCYDNNNNNNEKTKIMNQQNKEKVYGMLLFQDAVVPIKDNDTTITTKNKNFNSNNNKRMDLDNDDDEDEPEWEKEWNINDFDDIDDDEDEEDDEDYDDDEDDDDTRTQKILQDTIKQLDYDEEDEESEDVTHLCIENEDGSFTYTDPETGESQIVFPELDHDHDHDHEHDDEDDEDDEEEENEDNEMTSDIVAGAASIPVKGMSMNDVLSDPISAFKRQRLNVGDTITAYVKYVPKKRQLYSTQNHPVNMFLTLLNPNLVGQKPMEIKKQKVLSKKYHRLLEKLGGLHRIQELIGIEMDGIVQATSKKNYQNSGTTTAADGGGGDWLYVQPIQANIVGTSSGMDNDNVDSSSPLLSSSVAVTLPIPVGVATIPPELLPVTFQKGDSVRIIVDGIDEERGQLSMRIVNKISP